MAKLQVGSALELDGGLTLTGPSLFSGMGSDFR